MPRPEIVFDADKHTYLVNGIPVPSVTTVIKATVPVPFVVGAWYGYKMGVEAAQKAMIHRANEHGTWDIPRQMVDLPTRLLEDDLAPDAKALINPNTNVKDAQDRGNFVHDWIEFFSINGDEPGWEIPKDYLSRIDGLRKWLDANDPQFHNAEIRTASVKDGYAGTLDAFVTFWSGPFKGKTARIDYKTSKNVYPNQHFPQLEAYENSEVECGEPPSDERLIIHIPESGKVIAKRSDTYTYEDFAVLLSCWKRQRLHKK